MLNLSLPVGETVRLSIFDSSDPENPLPRHVLVTAQRDDDGLLAISLGSDNSDLEGLAPGEYTLVPHAGSE